MGCDGRLATMVLRALMNYPGAGTLLGWPHDPWFLGWQGAQDL